jgi:hypothetical protein
MLGKTHIALTNNYLSIEEIPAILYQSQGFLSALKGT